MTREVSTTERTEHILEVRKATRWEQLAAKTPKGSKNKLKASVHFSWLQEGLAIAQRETLNMEMPRGSDLWRMAEGERTRVRCRRCGRLLLKSKCRGHLEEHKDGKQNWETAGRTRANIAD